MTNGISWGDLLYVEEEERLSNRTPEQVAADLRNKTQIRRKEIEGLRKYIVEKSIRQHCEPQKSVSAKPVLKHKMRKMCENFNLAAEKLPDETLYEGGCWAHKVGACPFMHPGEEEFFTFTDHRPLKLVGGKQAKLFEMTEKNVVWLSTKKPVQAAPVVSDAW